jgi:hypothetical protein
MHVSVVFKCSYRTLASLGLPKSRPSCAREDLSYHSYHSATTSNMSLPPPNQNASKRRSPVLRANAPNSLMSDLSLTPNEPSSRDSRSEVLSPSSKAAQDYENELLEEQGGESTKPEPGALADAISKLQSLRTSAAPSRATSPVASGASSPHAPGVPTVSERIALDRQPSVPGTPHFGAQTDM